MKQRVSTNGSGSIGPSPIGTAGQSLFEKNLTLRTEGQLSKSNENPFSLNNPNLKMTISDSGNAEEKKRFESLGSKGSYPKSIDSNAKSRNNG